MNCYVMSKKYKQNKKASKVSFGVLSESIAGASEAAKALAHATRNVAECARNMLYSNSEVTHDERT